MKNLKLLSLICAMCCTCFSFAQQAKLIAASQWAFGAPIDSLVVVHSPGRASVIRAGDDYYPYQPLDTNAQYDTATLYTYSGSGYKVLWKYVKSYGTGNTMMQYHAYKHNVVSGNFVSYDRYTYQYNTDNTVDSGVYEEYKPGPGTWMPMESYKYHYNGSGEPIAIVTSVWSQPPGSWSTDRRDSIWYDASGRDSLIARQAWNSTASQWQPIFKLRSEYDANNRKIRDTFYSGINLSHWTGYAYDASGNLLVDSAHIYVSASIGFVNDYKLKYTYSGGNLVTRERLSWDVGNGIYENEMRSVYTYNPAGQVISHVPEEWNGSWGPSPSQLRQYFYYAFPVSVSEVAGQNEHIKVYPVPAITNVNIEIAFENAADFTVTIFDMQGRMMKQWKEPAVKQYVKNISLGGLPAGNYFIQVRSASENYSQQLSVVR